MTQYDTDSSTIPDDTPSNPDTVTSFPATPFSVKVIIDDLNYRSEPSMKGKVNGQTGRGTFTIMEVQNGGWGRLKSGAGWIWLSNPTYCTVGKTVKTTDDSKKSIDELAKEVIRGDWGNGTERKEKLTAAGYDYTHVGLEDAENELRKMQTLEGARKEMGLSDKDDKPLKQNMFKVV